MDGTKVESIRIRIPAVLFNDPLWYGVYRPPPAVGISFASSTATPMFLIDCITPLIKLHLQKIWQSRIWAKPRRSKIPFCSEADQHLLNSVSKKLTDKTPQKDTMSVWDRIHSWKTEDSAIPECYQLNSNIQSCYYLKSTFWNRPMPTVCRI